MRAIILAVALVSALAVGCDVRGDLGDDYKPGQPAVWTPEPGTYKPKRCEILSNCP